ncbi:Ferric enterobactin receptor precursor [compost metagenome]
MYGRQKPREFVESRLEGTTGLSNREIGAYSIVGLNMNYKFTKDLSVKGGVSNLFDKQIYRENDGASTYNEPGRAYYAGVTMSF